MQGGEKFIKLATRGETFDTVMAAIGSHKVRPQACERNGDASRMSPSGHNQSLSTLLRCSLLCTAGAPHGRPRVSAVCALSICVAWAL